MMAMMMLLLAICSLASATILLSSNDAAVVVVRAQEEEKEEKKMIPVTVELFGRAESDVTFAKYLSLAKAFNQFAHLRALTPLDQQNIVRMNRDTLYSPSIIDFAKCTPSGVTLIFPPADVIGDRFVSAMIVSQDHDIIATKYPGDDNGEGIEITPSDVGTDKAFIGLRVFTDGSEEDLVKAHAVQDAFRIVPWNDAYESNGAEVDQETCEMSKEEYMAEVAMWDKDSLATVRDLIKELQKHSNATSGEMFGPNRDEMNYLYYLFGTATGWGGQPPEDAVYIYGPPSDIDTSGDVAYQITIPTNDLPLKRNPATGEFIGFWSITVYDKDGFMEPNALEVNSINSATAKYDGDQVTITLAPEATCVASPKNCIPITPSWNYIVRMYVPERSLIDGSYEAPKLQKME
ncbi:hypothetical protein PPROV_000785900 [Pycnococcus provasolii]|uniref:DUF1254 domain-containing protein n=1 Tax=Pycnococcus provasolii TaxID=41880 RepID=A0A830HQ62_9CHLO|nr:hypothetical protein PPROV_000785900 [Pycnococcus provasolii]